MTAYESSENLRIEAREVASDWKPLTGLYACRSCGEPAFLHPETNQIWGCLKCKFTTYSVFAYFKELPAEKAEI